MTVRRPVVMNRTQLLSLKNCALVLVVSALSIVGGLTYTLRAGSLKNLVDGAFLKGRLEDLLVNLAVFVGLLGLYHLLNVLADFIGVYNQTSMLSSLKMTYLGKLQRADFLYLKRLDAATAVSRIFDDGARMATFFNDTLPRVFTYATVGIVFSATFVRFSPKLFVLALVFLPVFAFPINFSRKSLVERNLAAQELQDKLFKFIKESHDGGLVIKSYGVERNFYRRFKELLTTWYEASALALKSTLLAQNFLPNLLNNLLPLVVFLITTLQVRRGEITVGTAVSFYYFLGAFYHSVGQLFSLTVSAVKNHVHIKRLGELMNAPVELCGNSEFRSFSEMKLADAGFRYDERAEPTFANANLEIRKGEKIAIVGNSGAGKSTLLNVLCGFLRLSSGSVQLNGRPMSAYELSELRGKVIIVQSNEFFFDDSVRNNLTLFEDISDSEICEAIDVCDCNFVYEFENGLDTAVGERGCRLSDGQRQRLALARALLRKPDVLILDEATSGLDVETEERVLRRIIERVPTVLLVSHRPSTVGLVQKVYRFVDGHLEGPFCHS